MSSRFLLAFAFVVAFGSQSARAEVSPEVLTITLDQGGLIQSRHRLLQATDAHVVIGVGGTEPHRRGAGLAGLGGADRSRALRISGICRTGHENQRRSEHWRTAHQLPWYEMVCHWFRAPSKFDRTLI